MFGIFVILICIIQLFGLPALIPPLGRRAQQSTKWRYGVVGGLSFVTFAGVFWFVMVLTPTISAIFYFMPYSPPQETKQMVIQELRQRRITPPILQTPCMTNDIEGCRIADEMESYDAVSVTDTWASYLWSWLTIIIPTLITGFCSWSFTRNPHHRKRKRRNDNDNLTLRI
jgi:peptidoglycan/LPS O-acetylase OafA/YrhL